MTITIKMYEGNTCLLVEEAVLIKTDEYKPGYLKVWYKRPGDTIRPEDIHMLEGRTEQFQFIKEKE